LVPGLYRRWSFVAVAAVVLAPGSGTAQSASPSSYESELLQVNGVRLQYMDFGGSGLPLIFVQDIHNYFEDEDPYYRELWAGFYERFTDRHRVLATVRRGYGGSDAPGWGYDVATQAEDVLALMTALDIPRAVLVGRPPATQDLTWIAEHHPERLAGLVYIGNPLVFRAPSMPDAQRFSELYAQASCDLQERAASLLDPRASWQPHFLADTTTRIHAAALRFTNPAYDRRSMSVRRIERLEAALDEVDSWEAECPGEEPYLALVDSLAADTERLTAIRRAFEDSDQTRLIDDGLVRAFGERMETILEPDDLPDWESVLEFYFPHMRRFLAEASERESLGDPDRLRRE
jgi:pimeloyl-ACP methyl ester carboxylesterase